MKIIRVVCFILLLSACGKSNHDSGNNHSYFKDIIINQTVGRGGQPFQRALGYFQLSSDPATQIMVASMGREEASDGWGFRIAGIDKASGTVKWVKGYELPSQYDIQLVTCATMDKNENIWVGGHCFTNNQSARLFLVKLDKQGNIVSSNTFSNYEGWRAYSLEVLSNGDLAFLTKGPGGMAVHRLTSSGQPVWSKQARVSGSFQVDDDYYGVNLFDMLSPENHGLAETSDGSIFFGSSCNSSSYVGGIDRLVRLSANGDSVFAKTYSLNNNQGIVRPLQLVANGNNLLMVDQAFSTISPVIGAAQYFSFLSMDGSITSSKMRVTHDQSGPTFSLNQVNIYNGNLYFTTCGDYEFNTYILDQSLNIKSSVKTVVAQDIGTDRGGISLYDANDQALYYLYNFGGAPGESNGFEVTRNTTNGNTCIKGPIVAPPVLELGDAQYTVAADQNIAISTMPAPTFTNLAWNTVTVTVVSTEAVCGQ